MSALITVRAKLSKAQHEAFLLLPGHTEEARVIQALGVAFEVAAQQALERNKNQLTIADEIRLTTERALAIKPASAMETQTE